MNGNKAGNDKRTYNEARAQGYIIDHVSTVWAIQPSSFRVLVGGRHLDCRKDDQIEFEGYMVTLDGLEVGLRGKLRVKKKGGK